MKPGGRANKETFYRSETSEESHRARKPVKIWEQDSGKELCGGGGGWGCTCGIPEKEGKKEATSGTEYGAGSGGRRLLTKQEWGGGGGGRLLNGMASGMIVLKDIKQGERAGTENKHQESQGNNNNY